MATLYELQRDFRHYLLGEAGAEQLLQHVERHGPDDVDARMRVYFDAYRLRLTEALKTDFSTLHAMAGDEQFNALCGAYIDQHPSTTASIRWFGRHLVEFLASSPPWNEYRIISDVAALDWAISLALDAADGSALGVDDLATVPQDAWPGLSFKPHPSVRTIDTTWNVGPLRSAADTDVEFPEQVRFDHPVRWLVWRQGMGALYRSMEVDEAFALEAVAYGECFAHICDGLCEWVDSQHAAMHAAGMLRRWVTDGVLSEVHGQ
ncbi:MAG: DUF2063 domain-containing protein [Chromatiales bacterium]|jgi:hypothetical protein|nr:DUF2063 domain-containing protein [Chromatiales bacterium]